MKIFYVGSLKNPRKFYALLRKLTGEKRITRRVLDNLVIDNQQKTITASNGAYQLRF